jgi:hypothetical protein
MSTRRFRTQAEQNAYDLGRADVGQKREPLTLEAIKAMTPEEAAARIDEVNAFMAAPPVAAVAAGGDDDDE